MWFEKLPSFYWEECRKAGSVERLVYEDGDGAQRYALVYLPCGYSPEQEEKIDTLYFMHGAAGTPEDLAGEQGFFPRVLDNMIAFGDCTPLVAVFPSYYPDETARASATMEGDRDAVKVFPNVLRSSLLPAVERHYRTGGTREKRIFGGFSMGGVATWEMFLRAGDLFSCFMPFGGDCWHLEWMGGKVRSAETAAVLIRAAEAVLARGEEFSVCAAAGERDSALAAIGALADELKKSAAFSSERFAVREAAGERHDYACAAQLLYSALKERGQKGENYAI